MSKQVYKYEDPFYLEGGRRLNGLEITYHTYGTLNKEKNNVIWVCHALTANSDVADWWKGLVGSGYLFNPEEHFIVCANILGSCYGSTGPLSVNADTGLPDYHLFPDISVRDMVTAHEL